MSEWKDLIEDGYLQIAINGSCIELKNNVGRILSIAGASEANEACYAEICNIFAEAGKWVIGLDGADVNEALFREDTGVGHYLKWNLKDDIQTTEDEVKHIVDTIKKDKESVAAFVWGYGDMSILDFTSAIEKVNIPDDVDIVITLAFVENEEASIHAIIA